MEVHSAKPKAGGISVPACLPLGRNALPSLSSSASKRPGPQLARTFFTVSTSTPRRSVNGLRFGRKGDDCANVQIAVSPAVEPPSDSRCERVVHGRVTRTGFPLI